MRSAPCEPLIDNRRPCCASVHAQAKPEGTPYFGTEVFTFFADYLGKFLVACGQQSEWRHFQQFKENRKNEALN